MSRGFTVELWSREGYLSTVFGRNGLTNQLAFSPDGATLATSGDEWHRYLPDVPFRPMCQ